MFLIKIHYVATDENKNFKGEEQVWYRGKKDWLVSKDEFPSEYGFKNFGFKTKASAMKAFNSRKELALDEETFGNWKVNVDLVEMNF